MSQMLENALKEHILPLQFVGDIRERGLYFAVEFVADKESKATFPPAVKFSDKVWDCARELRLSILGNIGTTSEYNVELVVVSPAYTVAEEEIHEIVQRLREAVVQVSLEYEADLMRNGGSTSRLTL
jgi:adenosylmethionine-8-amino-7-oxononanoate aminotransferase